MTAATVALTVAVQVALYVTIDPFGRRAKRRWERVWRERATSTVDRS